MNRQKKKLSLWFYFSLFDLKNKTNWKNSATPDIKNTSETDPLHIFIFQRKHDIKMMRWAVTFVQLTLLSWCISVFFFPSPHSETTGLDHGDGFYAGMPIPCADSYAGYCVHGKCEIKYNMATCRSVTIWVSAANVSELMLILLLILLFPIRRQRATETFINRC